MKLKPMRDYTGASYPGLAEYFDRHEKGSLTSTAKLALALALLAAFFAGCNPPNIG